MKKIVVTFFQKIYVVFIFMMIITVGLGIVWVVLFGMIQQKTISSIEQFENTQSQMQAFYELNQQKKLIATTSEERNKLDIYFPDQNSAPGFFEALEATAVRSNVDMNIVSAQLGQKKDTGFKVQISAQGSFRDVYYFFMTLEDMPVGSTITQFVINKNTVDSEDISRGDWVGLFDVEVVGYSQ